MTFEYTPMGVCEQCGTVWKQEHLLEFSGRLYKVNLLGGNDGLIKNLRQAASGAGSGGSEPKRA